MAADDRRDWHRLLGVIFQDFCKGTALEVDLEKDLSLQQQYLDVILLHRRPGEPIPRLPDGFEDLAEHNLITFKSHREALDGWALKELVGHYVNYRKQASPSADDLRPESDFRLFALAARFPAGLAGQLTLTPVRAGVYDCLYGLDTIRLVVVNQLEQQPHNAMLQLFSAVEAQVRYAAQNYRQQSPGTTTLLRMLLEAYLGEGIGMAGTLEEWLHEKKEKARKNLVADIIRLTPELEGLEHLPPDELIKMAAAVELVKELPVRERLKGIPVQERLEGIPLEQRLQGVPIEQRLQGVPLEQRLEGVPLEQRLEGVPLEQRLQGVSADDLRALLNRLEKGDPSAPPGAEPRPNS